MKAHLRSARIAPKKANIIAKMVRGMPVSEAIHSLSRTNKKGARMVEQLLKSAVANAEHNDKQDTRNLVIKTIVVNQSIGYRRGVPMARGRVRSMTKFLSHISLTLGLQEGEPEKDAPRKTAPAAKKTAKSPSQKAKTPVKTSGTAAKTPEASSKSSASSDASSSSAHT